MSAALAVDVSAVFENGFFVDDRSLAPSIYVSTNGIVTLGAGNSALSARNQLTTPTNDPIFAAFWTDIDPRGGKTDTNENRIHVDIDPVGDVVTVTWLAVDEYPASPNSPQNTFQMQLFDRGDEGFEVAFRYDDVLWDDDAAAGYNLGPLYQEVFGVQGGAINLDTSPGNSGETGLWTLLVEAPNIIAGTEADDVLEGTDGLDSIQGQAGADLLSGAAGRDFLAGDAGNDTLDGGADHDRLQGHDGDDRLLGQDGNDVLDGGAGDDALLGGEGSDTLTGGEGADRLEGDAGADSLAGGDGDDRLGGGAGNDTLHGQSGHDVLDGGDGADLLRGDMGDDSLIGGLGNDALYGGAADDRLQGGMGNDSLWSGTGQDILDGGEGNDLLNGLEAGAVRLIGGAGSDVYWIKGSSGERIEELAAGLDDGSTDTVISYGSFNASGIHIEAIELRSMVTSRAIGNGLDNLIIGSGGNNLIDGGRNDDTMVGGAGNDLYFVRDRGDVVVETVQGGRDGIKAFLNWKLGHNIEVLHLMGQESLNGIGNALDNVIIGNQAANLIIGREGSDVLRGQGGADTFVFDRALGTNNVDRIIDFNTNMAEEGDRLFLKGAVFGDLEAGLLEAERFHLGTGAQDAEDRFIFDSTLGQLWFDADGTGAAAQQLVASFDQNASVTAADIELF